MPPTTTKYTHATQKIKRTTHTLLILLATTYHTHNAHAAPPTAAPTHTPTRTHSKIKHPSSSTTTARDSQHTVPLMPTHLHPQPPSSSDSTSTSTPTPPPSTSVPLANARRPSLLSVGRPFCYFHNPLDGAKISLYYRKFGHGKSKILFIMGTAASHHAWWKQVEYLSRHHTVCVFDNRGTGLSSCPDGPYSTDAMAEDTLKLMDHLGWQRAHVVGFSLGGMIAMKVAARAKPRVKSLALISTHTGGFFRRVPTLAGLNLLARIPFVRSAEQRARLDLQCHYKADFLERPDPRSGGERVGNRLYRRYLRAHTRTDLRCHGLNSQVAAILSHRMSHANLRSIREASVPKLVAHGDRDVIIHPSNAVHLSAAIDADLEILDANHMSVVECADELNRLLEAHVARADDMALETSTYFGAYYRFKHRLRRKLSRAWARWHSSWLQRSRTRLARLRYYRTRYLHQRAARIARWTLAPYFYRVTRWALLLTSVELLSALPWRDGGAAEGDGGQRGRAVGPLRPRVWAATLTHRVRGAATTAATTARARFAISRARLRKRASVGAAKLLEWSGAARRRAHVMLERALDAARPRLERAWMGVIVSPQRLANSATQLLPLIGRRVPGTSVRAGAVAYRR